MCLLQDIARLNRQPPNSERHMEVKGVGRGIAVMTDGSRAVAIPDSRPVGREERQVQEPKQKPKGE